MANQQAPRDQNQVPSLLAIDDVTGETRQVLTDEDGNLLVAATIAGGITGPGSSTDNAIVRWDGTDGETVQNSVVTVGDTGNFAGVGTINTLVLPASDFVGRTDTQTLTNKTLTSPVLTTPSLGVASATSINGLTITSTTGTFTLTDAKTLSVLKTMSLNAADDTGVYTLPTGTKTLVATDVVTLSSLTTVGTLVAGNATAIVDAATDAAAGKIEIATAAETTTGTDATRAVSPDGLAGSDYGIRLVEIQVIAAGTVVATGDGNGNVRFVVPAQMNGWNLVVAHAAVSTAGTTNTTDIQIHNVTDGADMLSTKITIDSGEKTSYTAATPPVINGATDDVATGDEIRIDVDAVSTTPPQGLNVILGFQLP